MASVENNAYGAARPAQQQQHQHQRSKSSVLKSFMHRRNNSDGSALPSAGLSNTSQPKVQATTQQDMGFPNFSRPAALGEIQQNQVGGAPRSPSKQDERPSASRSPSKDTFATVHVKPIAAKEKQDTARVKPKKTKSTTNLAGLLSRPKSLKNLHKLASQDDVLSRKDKENRSPPCSVTPLELPRPPIYAQFSSGALEKQSGQVDQNVFGHGYTQNVSSTDVSGRLAKPRPKSYHAQYTASSTDSKQSSISAKSSPSKIQRGLKIFTNGSGFKNNQPSVEDSGQVLDPKDVDKHLEAMLDRRNIPEHQRYKMRNLADTIKMEFIRQDWAESRGINNARPESHDSDSSMTGTQPNDESKAKQSRGRTFTLSRNNGKKSEPSSPTKKQKGEGTIGRHFRSRSTDSVASERPSSAGSKEGSGTGILSKIKLQQGPSDYVNYLRKVQKPQAVEVGKLHKLRLLLRNETVVWTEEFIRQGGMQEIVALLHRIMEVEWREEHEDALLHENLLCLKALCTTALALQYLHSIQATLFPALLHMLFDPEKKGPSEFTTRNIITSVLFTYIQSASPQDRPIRAKTVLGQIRDPEPKEDERPVGFVMEMRRDRPYRVWCKESTNVTKEVFWIFLHHLNIVYLPRDKEAKAGTGPSGVDSLTYMQSHFPQERPPVPAAPYVGGVEWDATNYLASHLDLLNAIIACTGTAEERNNLRGLLRISGWERCMGGSLRLCKEKFYPGVHDAMRTWVAAAADDGWNVHDVRYGPPAEPRSPTKKYPGASSPKKKEDIAPPKIEMPKLDFGRDAANGPVVSPMVKASDDWLS
ncbi:Uu.00g127080.m01.CDS01 [Anthostomella pinea]|uniref:Uu.00g127080.m01.CDS01 n=1 Tax=Anthostomella pinea TaxID=933095 RepID=A0AAI8VI06_9PEZI|nr:Uu.00g127080.m01.CDS01 [Anthostomella pinea]